MHLYSRTAAILLLIAFVSVFVGPRALHAQSLPSGWSQTDIGSGTGSGSFAGDVYSLTSGGAGPGGTSDSIHFIYQQLSGDGSITGRMSTEWDLGLMIRETLDPGSTMVFTRYYPTPPALFYRATTGASMASQSGGIYVPNGHPWWFRITRSGDQFTAYDSEDAITWYAIGSSQTISMAQTVYVGLAVGGTSGTIDHVTVDSPSAPAPSIANVSTTSAAVGEQVQLSGANFGSTQSASLVYLNGAPVTVDSWSNSAISITLPSGASSGLMDVSVAPAMNDSNPIEFDVTSQPLPIPWLDQDIGQSLAQGTGIYQAGTFTVTGNGTNGSGSSDAIHFVYQPLNGDGSIVGRISSIQGSNPTIMIRDTLDPGALISFLTFSPNLALFQNRTTANAGISVQQVGVDGPGVPYWVKITRSGSTFTGYLSFDGYLWEPIGSPQQLSMGQNVFVGLSVDDSTATFLQPLERPGIRCSSLEAVLAAPKAIALRRSMAFR